MGDHLATIECVELPGIGVVWLKARRSRTGPTEGRPMHSGVCRKGCISALCFSSVVLQATVQPQCLNSSTWTTRLRQRAARGLKPQRSYPELLCEQCCSHCNSHVNS